MVNDSLDEVWDEVKRREPPPKRTGVWPVLSAVASLVGTVAFVFLEVALFVALMVGAVVAGMLRGARRNRR